MPRTWMSLFHATLPESPDLQEFVRNLQESSSDIAYTVLRLVAQDVIAYLKSYTSRKAPPRYRRTMGPDPADPEFRIRYFKYQQKKQDPDRPTHPGGWADVSFELARSYWAKVEQVDAGWQLVVGNASGHAVYVEAKDGYFVVTGVMDPGGPVDKAIRKAFRQLSPGWAIKNAPGRIETAGKLTGPQQSLFAYPTQGSDADLAGEDG